MLFLPQSNVFLQRVGFDPEKKTYSKSLAPLNFEKEIFIDRYLLENRGETTSEFFLFFFFFSFLCSFAFISSSPINFEIYFFRDT